MEDKIVIPAVGEEYWFYANDQIKKNTEYRATIRRIIPFEESANVFIHKYNDIIEDLVKEPLMDLWLEQIEELFWILAEETDFIIELSIPELCPQCVFVARTVDGGWHSFETISSKEFGLLDIDNENYNKLHNVNDSEIDK